MVNPATQVSQQGLDSIPTFFCVQRWFHPKATSPYSQRMAASGSLGYILPSSHLAGAIRNSYISLFMSYGLELVPMSIPSPITVKGNQIIHTSSRYIPRTM